MKLTRIETRDGLSAFIDQTLVVEITPVHNDAKACIVVARELKRDIFSSFGSSGYECRVVAKGTPDEVAALLGLYVAPVAATAERGEGERG